MSVEGLDVEGVEGVGIEEVVVEGVEGVGGDD